MFLTWHLPEGFGPGTNVGVAFRMDGTYTPKAFWIYSKVAPALSHVIVDINKNGVSIFENADHRPRLVFETEQYEQFVPMSGFADGDIITLDVDQHHDQQASLVVQLEVE